MKRSEVSSEIFRGINVKECEYKEITKVYYQLGGHVFKGRIGEDSSVYGIGVDITSDDKVQFLIPVPTVNNDEPFEVYVGSIIKYSDLKSFQLKRL